MESLNLPSILTPDFGLLFWMLVAFVALFIILSKFGFPAIIGMVEARKNFIDESLKDARAAHEQLASIQSESERILREAREQQSEILKEAMVMRDAIVKEAQAKAAAESAKLLAEAKVQIQGEKTKALRDIRGQVAALSLEIAEKVMMRELQEGGAQETYINRVLDEIEK